MFFLINYRDDGQINNSLWYKIMRLQKHKIQNISATLALTIGTFLSISNSSQAAIFTTNFTQIGGSKGDIELNSITQNGETFDSFISIKNVEIDWTKTTKVDQTKGTRSNGETGSGSINNTGSLSTEKTDNSTSSILVSGTKDVTNDQVKEVFNDKYLSTFLDGEDDGFFSMKMFFDQKITQDNTGLDSLFFWERGMNSDLTVSAVDEKGKVIGQSVKLVRTGGLSTEKNNLSNLQTTLTKLSSIDIPTSQTQIATTRQEINTLNNTIVTLTSQIPNLEGNVQTSQSKVDSLNAQLAVRGLSNRDRRNLNSQLSTANTELNNAKKALTSTNNSLTSTQNTLTTKNTALETQTKNLQLLESQVSTTQSKIETSKTDIANRESNYAGFDINSLEINNTQKVGSWGVNLKQFGVKSIYGILLQGNGVADSGADIVGVVARRKVPESSNLFGLAVVGGIAYFYRRNQKSRKMSLL
ncbi:exosortase-dependent surface protein XDP2 [Calothrix sp. PCC 6303]|uniref:exosortase-dependent surface protein XDP2 n=1 Tax=Calothrix sp. PCC 6303 TaxID=1170562 RepID=UPI0002A007F3|nr:exosortase-dependent surface protein XDP2 [Calothrix sp. PCC 6303]AFZ00928.1 PEP motif putative anchor domain protein [Calothrix sp. PCC 6303]